MPAVTKRTHYNCFVLFYGLLLTSKRRKK